MKVRYLTIIFAFFFCSIASAQVLIPPENIKVSYNIANNHVQIFWKPSPSPDVTYYEVWYADDELSVGQISFQKVPGSDFVNATDPLQLEFKHLRALENSNGYFITAYGPGNAESGTAPCDSTVYLKVDFDSCFASASLRWNDYNRWRGNIAGYKVYSSTDGSNYNLLQTIESNTTSTIINNLDANQLYRFYVLALKKTPADSSYSNRVDVSTRMAVNPSYITANYGSAETGHPFVSFSADPASEQTHYRLLRADSPTGPFDTISSINTDSKSIDYTDINADASSQAFYYRLDAYNYCGNLIMSSDNVAGTIFLQSDVSNNTVNLRWNSYQNWPEGVENYIVERNIGQMGYETVSTTSDLSFTDNTFEGTGNQPSESDVCYRVSAKKKSMITPALSISNEICIELNSNIRFEFNAFTPGSDQNSTFGPTVDFLPKSVTFSIYNRWGNKLFETSDSNNLRWDGTYDGKYVDQGVYRYQLEYTNDRGKKTVLHGNVTVIYP
jgi:gliding motility-associated-like protein